MTKEQYGPESRDGPSAPNATTDLAPYVDRHRTLRKDFILIARQDDAGDLVIVTVADVESESHPGASSEPGAAFD